jgi:hypothetical protein
MACECAKCREHYKTLGFMFGVPTESEMEEAYRELVKQWHPDLYENYASLRADAEEHFKQIQVAYRGLKEHNTGTAGEAPVASVVVQTQKRQEPRQEEKPVLSFGGAFGCLAAKQFTPQIEEMIAPHLGKLGLALAIVDLSGNPSHATYSQFLLLASRGIMMRDSRHNISVLWYADLGEINLIDRQKGGKQSSWQKLMGGISGSQPDYELQINRSNGVNFCVISTQVDDSVKTVIYDFLTNQKAQARQQAG